MLRDLVQSSLPRLFVMKRRMLSYLVALYAVLAVAMFLFGFIATLQLYL